MEFDETMTEADFSRPLLDSHEEHYVSQGEPDLAVDGLEATLVMRLLGLLTGKSS
ncbi:MAG TPA: hypothetical protein VFV10_06340 [Gammaproteobacteria bacterium]|nr:hypothetical protein [Gammaproteobacteria bacterium]